MGSPARSLAEVQYRLLDLRPPARPRLVPPPPPVEIQQREDVAKLRASLELKIAAQLRSGSELVRAVAQQRRGEVIATTLAPLDALLGGGLSRGTLTELTALPSAGRFSIVLSTLASITTMGEAAALIDLGDHFDPQTAVDNGIELERLLWVRPRKLKDAVHAAELLSSTGISMIVIDAGVPPIRGRVADASWIRLARSAEARGTTLLVASPYPMTRTASEAVLSASRARTKWLGRGQSPRLLDSIAVEVELQRHRRLRPGAKTKLTFVAPESIASEAAAREEMR